MVTKQLRQIPSSKEIVAEKGYSDLLYGHLQEISKYEPITNIRYVEKKNLTAASIARVLDISRQTAAKRIQALIDNELLYYNEGLKRYELVPLESNLAALLPKSTIRVICNTLRERTLSILVYLIKWAYAHDCKPCEINIELIKNYLGVSSTNRGWCNEIVTDSLVVLQKLGLIEYHIEATIDQNNNNFITKHYILDSLKNGVDLSAEEIILHYSSAKTIKMLKNCTEDENLKC